MKFSVITDYPLWFIFFCLAAGGMYSFVLYRKEKKFEEVAVWITRLMAAFRFVVVFVLAFFLLSPLIKSSSRDVEKPVIIIAQDNSESLMIGKDSSFYKNEYKKKLEELIGELADKYDTNTFSFGEKISGGINFSYTDKQTDISELFSEIETKFSGRNVGAVIVASDGLFNKGQNPVYSSGKTKFPVYTIALGDTSVKKDLILSKVAYNRLAYLGNKFPLEIVIDAQQLKGKSTTLTVNKGKQNLITQKIDIPNESFNVTIPLQLEAKETGMQRYSVVLSPLEGEISTVNNYKDIFIDVLDARQKILVLADAPHPDIFAIKSAIETNDNYEVETAMAAEFSKSLAGYNLVVMFRLPSFQNKIIEKLSEINQKSIPVLYVCGTEMNYGTWNTFQNCLSISPSGKAKPNDVTAVTAKEFSLFTLSDEAKHYFSKFPPMQTVFGNFKPGNSTTVLLYQRIGMVETKDPLICFSQNADKKVGVIAGEGIWRWKLNDFAEHANHNVFNDLITKTVQYLSVKVDKSFFRVVSKNNFYENETVEFDAEVYNESYELINEPEVSITITNADNKKFPFTFSKTSNAYRLDAGMFPVGEYKYEAKVKVGDKIYSDKGVFSVSALQVESVNTTADHQLLFSLAKKHGGEMVYTDELNKLSEMLNKREDIKSISYSQKKLTDLINFKWIFFLLISLLSLEWFLRKRNGAY